MIDKKEVNLVATSTIITIILVYILNKFLEIKIVNVHNKWLGIAMIIYISGIIMISLFTSTNLLNYPSINNYKTMLKYYVAVIGVILLIKIFIPQLIPEINITMEPITQMIFPPELTLF